VEKQNVTVTVPRSLLRKVKIVAAKRETSISAMLVAMLQELVARDTEGDAAVRRLLARARKGYDLGTHGRLRLSREQLHER